MARILKIVGVLAAIILMTGAAHAAGPTDDKSSFDWSGVSIGAFAGYSWVDLEYYEPDYPGYDRNPDFDGFSGGVFLGYNYQFDSIVLGVEADGGYVDLSEGRDKNALNNDYSAFEIDWNAHFRARIGFALDSTLFYVAGGLALAEVTVDDKDSGYGEDDATHVGWTLGTGIEYAMTKNLRARIEYLYDDYGSEDYKIGDGSGYTYDSNVELISHTIRVGLSFCF